MSAHFHENLVPRPDSEIERAQDALRKANIRWGMEVGVYEAEIHDLDSARARAAMDEVANAGRRIHELRGDTKPASSLRPFVSPKGIMRALGKVLGL